MTILALLLGFVKAGFGFIFKALSFLMRIVIPIPLLIILIVGGWWYFDKTSYAKKMVEEALADVFAKAKIESLQLDNQIKDIVIDRYKSIIEEDKELKAAYAAAEEDFNNQKLADDLLTIKLTEDLKNVQKLTPPKPVTTESKDKVCNDTVDTQFLDWMRNLQRR